MERRYKFYTTRQKKNQSLRDYGNVIKSRFNSMKRAQNQPVEFHSHTSSIVFVMGLYDDSLKKRMRKWLREFGYYYSDKLKLRQTILISEIFENTQINTFTFPLT